MSCYCNSIIISIQSFCLLFAGMLRAICLDMCVFVLTLLLQQLKLQIFDEINNWLMNFNCLKQIKNIFMTTWHGVMDANLSVAWRFDYSPNGDIATSSNFDEINNIIILHGDRYSQKMVKKQRRFIFSMTFILLSLSRCSFLGLFQATWLGILNTFKLCAPRHIRMYINHSSHMYVCWINIVTNGMQSIFVAYLYQ